MYLLDLEKIRSANPDNQYPIELDLVSRWLGIPYKLCTKLIKSLDEQDYTVTRSFMKTEYSLSIDGYKHFLLMSPTSDGRAYRESLLDQEKQHEKFRRDLLNLVYNF